MNDKQCNSQFESKGSGEITNLKNIISSDGDLNYVDYNPICSVNDLKDKVVNKSSFSKIECSSIPADCSELKVNAKIENHVQKDMHNSGGLTNDLKDKIEIFSSLLSNKNEENELKVNTEGEIHEQNDYLCSNFAESKENCEVKNLENVCNDMDDNLKNEVSNPICLVNNSRDENVLKSNINTKLEIREMFDEFNTLGLNAQLSNGIYHHGFQRLLTLQQQCILHCINGRDIVLHSYPCAGKSTMCLISVLQRINTSFNECQAIILVPTYELALYTQRV